MKYEWQHIRNGSAPADMMTTYCNTPTGCMTDEGADDHPFVVSHPGLNLTPDGEWIQAPGFESRGSVEQLQVSSGSDVNHAFCLRPNPANVELHDQIAAAKDRIDELQEKIEEAAGIARDAASHHQSIEHGLALSVARLQGNLNNAHESNRRLENSLGKAHAELERFKAIEGIAGKYNEEEYDAMRTKVEDLEQCLAIAKHDYLERAGDLNNRLKSIESWCNQPAGNPLLRSAQAYVLKLVRGEA